VTALLSLALGSRSIPLGTVVDVLVVVMKAGVVVTQGSPREVVTAELLQKVFGLRADVLDDPRTGLPVVVPVLAPAPVVSL
jgi:ABC-type cobalamin/Fe3+-siderophores transport system ATPase subunit